MTSASSSEIRWSGIRISGRCPALAAVVTPSVGGTATPHRRNPLAPFDAEPAFPDQLNVSRQVWKSHSHTKFAKVQYGYRDCRSS
jgi:hypothetical protein